MVRKRTKFDPVKHEEFMARARKEVAEREAGYRARALRLFPHVCGRCGREFEGKRLPELTVHHRDHNHANNPPDGSNWELLCLYCHDHEHEKYLMAGHHQGTEQRDEPTARVFSPFEGLDGLDGLFGAAAEQGTTRP
jgi:hypothetical protein